jgi:hypothetical protein
MRTRGGAWGSNDGLLNGAVAVIVTLATGLGARSLGGRLPTGGLVVVVLATTSAAFGVLSL